MWLLIRHLFVTHLIGSKRSWSPCTADRLAALSSTHVCTQSCVHHAGKGAARFCDPLIQPGRNRKNSPICNSLSWEARCEAWPYQFPVEFQIKLSLDHFLHDCPKPSPTLVNHWIPLVQWGLHYQERAYMCGSIIHNGNPRRNPQKVKSSSKEPSASCTPNTTAFFVFA